MKFEVEPGADYKRLDVWLAEKLEGFSRSRIRKLIDKGYVTVDGQSASAHRKAAPGAKVEVIVPEPEPVALVPEDIPLDVLFEDSELIVINKPAGIVVHPGAGRTTGTIVNALLHHCNDLAGIGDERRPGIVHRLDKDTSGALVCAKTAITMEGLSRQFKESRVHKEYIALVAGVPEPSGGNIDKPITRSGSDRKKMAVADTRWKERSSGNRTLREAQTGYNVEEDYGDCSLVRFYPRTGRTHQIRVHAKSIGHHILGDKQYRSRRQEPRLDAPVSRQMLHAETLSFCHPVLKDKLNINAPWPEDFERMVSLLRRRGYRDRQVELFGGKNNSG